MGKKTKNSIKFLSWLNSMFPSNHRKNEIQSIEKKYSKKVKAQKKHLKEIREK